jgi:hypothetical protein
LVFNVYFDIGKGVKPKNAAAGKVRRRIFGINYFVEVPKSRNPIRPLKLRIGSKGE